MTCISEHHNHIKNDNKNNNRSNNQVIVINTKKMNGTNSKGDREKGDLKRLNTHVCWCVGVPTDINVCCIWPQFQVSMCIDNGQVAFPAKQMGSFSTNTRGRSTANRMQFIIQWLPSLIDIFKSESFLIVIIVIIIVIFSLLLLLLLLFLWFLLILK